MRSATLEDMPQLVRLAELFCHELNERCDPASIEATATGMIENDNAALIIGPNSMAGAMVVPHFFDASRSIAAELFWYVEPHARGAGEGSLILEALENWARENGAGRLTMVAMTALDKVVGRIYEAHGYKPFETTWIKEL